MEQWRSLRLPEELCRKAEQQLGSRFAGLEELLISLLQELVREDGAQLDQAELQILEQRLKDLGYL